LQDEEFKQLGVDTVIRAYELLESKAWKVEKMMANNDVIYVTTKPIGKVYKLRAKVNYPAKKLLQDLFNNIEEVPKWNPTLLESRVIKVRI
jgi:StAR-related lipid transfer protein 3